MGIRSQQRRRLQKKNRTGATAIEFAIVVPVFFLFIIASFDFARMNVIRHTADNAAYEAARHAMVPGATVAEAVTKANGILSTVGITGTTVSVSPAALGPNVDEIIVTVDVPMDQNGWIAPYFSRGKIINARSRLKTERANN